jgi:hypothetical protein
VATVAQVVASFTSVQRLLPMPDQSLQMVVLVGMVSQLELRVLEPVQVVVAD